MVIYYYSYYIDEKNQPSPRDGGWSALVDHDKKTIKLYINTIEPENQYKKDFKTCDFFIFQRSNTSVINLVQALKENKYKIIKKIEDPHPWERKRENK